MGAIDYPINALRIAIASEATFIARTLDNVPTHMAYVLERALKHKGVSFVEIYQNCIIFNDKTFDSVTGRDYREERMVYLEHGKPLVFGKNMDKAVKVKRLRPTVIKLSERAPNEELLVHDEKATDANHAYLLTQMEYPEFPVPFGVFRDIERPTYDEMMDRQVEEAIKQKGKGSLKELIYGGETWTVGA